jgi:hypothetical protein
MPVMRPEGMTWEKYFDELVEKNIGKLMRYYQK